MKKLLFALLCLLSSSVSANIIKIDGNPLGFDVTTGAGVMGFTFTAYPDQDHADPDHLPIPNLVMIEAVIYFDFVDFYDPSKTYHDGFKIFHNYLYGQDAVQSWDTITLRIYGNKGGDGSLIDYTDGARWNGGGVISYYIDDGISQVPIPAALPLMASALGIFGLARRY